VASDRTKATIAKVTWVGRVVKSKVDKVIVSKLRSENIIGYRRLESLQDVCQRKRIATLSNQIWWWYTCHQRHLPHSECKRFSQPLKTMDGPIQRYGK